MNDAYSFSCRFSWLFLPLTQLVTMISFAMHTCDYIQQHYHHHQQVGTNNNKNKITINVVYELKRNANYFIWWCINIMRFISLSTVSLIWVFYSSAYAWIAREYKISLPTNSGKIHDWIKNIEYISHRENLR